MKLDSLWLLQNSIKKFGSEILPKFIECIVIATMLPRPSTTEKFRKKNVFVLIISILEMQDLARGRNIFRLNFCFLLTIVAIVIVLTKTEEYRFPIKRLPSANVFRSP